MCLKTDTTVLFFNDSIVHGIIHENSTAKEYETTYTLFIIYILIIVVSKKTKYCLIMRLRAL